MTYDLMLAAWFGLFGLAFGSFLNVCIHRLPRRIVLLDERDQALQEGNTERAAELDAQVRSFSLWRTRSACPHCKHQIAWYDNIPVLSWLVLRGRCRNCRAPISPRYITVELLTAALFIACYAAFDATWMAARFCAFSFFLVGLIFCDAEWKLLPDALTLPGILVGLGSSVLVPLHDFLVHPASQHWRWVSLAQSAGGVLAGAAFIYGAGMLYLLARPDLREHGRVAMGFGDVKLMAMVGAFLGVTLTVLTVFAASIAGAVFGVAVVLRVWAKRARRARARSMPAGRAWQSATLAFRYFQVPFGVFLGAAAIAAGFFGEQVVRWYAGFF